METPSDSIPVYTHLGEAIHGVCQSWCAENGYSDPFCRNGEWWAFPPNGVMPVPIKEVMGDECQQLIKIGPAILTLFPDGSLLTESKL